MADPFNTRAATAADQALISDMQYAASSSGCAAVRYEGEHSAIMLRTGDVT